MFGTKQVNSGKKGEKHKSKETIACHVFAYLKKYGAVSYSFSCSKAMTIYKVPNVCWDARFLQSIFKIRGR